MSVQIIPMSHMALNTHSNPFKQNSSVRLCLYSKYKAIQTKQLSPTMFIFKVQSHSNKTAQSDYVYIQSTKPFKQNSSVRLCLYSKYKAIQTKQLSPTMFIFKVQSHSNKTAQPDYVYIQSTKPFKQNSSVRLCLYSRYKDCSKLCFGWNTMDYVKLREWKFPSCVQHSHQLELLPMAVTQVSIKPHDTNYKYSTCAPTQLVI